MRPGDLDAFKRESEALVEGEVRTLIDAPWPEPASAGERVLADEPPRAHAEPLDPSTRLHVELNPGLPPLDEGLPFDRKGMTSSRRSRRGSRMRCVPIRECSCTARMWADSTAARSCCCVLC